MYLSQSLLSFYNIRHFKRTEIKHIMFFMLSIAYKYIFYNNVRLLITFSKLTIIFATKIHQIKKIT